MVMAMSDYFIHYWWLIFGTLFLGGYVFIQSFGSARERCRWSWTSLLLKMPIFGLTW